MELLREGARIGTGLDGAGPVDDSEEALLIDSKHMKTHTRFAVVLLLLPSSPWLAADGLLRDQAEQCRALDRLKDIRATIHSIPNRDRGPVIKEAFELHAKLEGEHPGAQRPFTDLTQEVHAAGEAFFGPFKSKRGEGGRKNFGGISGGNMDVTIEYPTPPAAAGVLEQDLPPRITCYVNIIKGDINDAKWERYEWR